MNVGIMSDAAVRAKCAENYPLALASYQNYMPPSHSTLHALSGVKQSKYERTPSRPSRASHMLNSVGRLSGNELAFRVAWEQAAAENTPVNIFRNAIPPPQMQGVGAGGVRLGQAPVPAPPPQAGVVGGQPPVAPPPVAQQHTPVAPQHAPQGGGGGNLSGLDFLGQTARGQRVAGGMLHSLRRLRAADPTGAGAGSQMPENAPPPVQGTPLPMGQQAHPLATGRMQPQAPSALGGWTAPQTPQRPAKGKAVVQGHVMMGDQPTGRERKHNLVNKFSKDKWLVEPQVQKYILRHIDPQGQDPQALDKYFSYKEDKLPRSGTGTRGGKLRDVWYHDEQTARATLGRMGVSNPLPHNIGGGMRLARLAAGVGEEGDVGHEDKREDVEYQIGQEMHEWDQYVPLTTAGETWVFANQYSQAVERDMVFLKPAVGNVVPSEYSEYSPLPPAPPPRQMAQTPGGEAGSSSDAQGLATPE